MPDSISWEATTGFSLKTKSPTKEVHSWEKKFTIERPNAERLIILKAKERGQRLELWDSDRLITAVHKRARGCEWISVLGVQVGIAAIYKWLVFRGWPLSKYWRLLPFGRGLGAEYWMTLNIPIVTGLVLKYDISRASVDRGIWTYHETQHKLWRNQIAVGCLS